MADRCLEVAESYLPDGWTVVYRRNLTGRCYYHKKEIATPRPVTRRALHIFLHECAHAVLHRPRSSKLRHREEYEAERWAFARMRENGIAVPRKALQRAKQYVAWKIRQAERRGAKRIDPETRRWALGR